MLEKCFAEGSVHRLGALLQRLQRQQHLQQARARLARRPRQRILHLQACRAMLAGAAAQQDLLQDTAS